MNIAAIATGGAVGAVLRHLLARRVQMNAGIGRSGTMHEARWPELASDLPLTLEFFDRPENVERVLADIEKDFEPGHVVTWTATANL